MYSLLRKGKINVYCMTLGSMQTNTYLVYDEQKNCFISDPASNIEEIAVKVTELGLKVQGVLLTHGHFDHIGAADDVRKKYDVKIYGMEAEREVFESSDNNLSSLFGQPFTVRVDEFLKDGQNINVAGFDIHIIHTPGHTKGGCCYLVSKENEKILISGDTMFCGTYGRYDFPTGNYRELISSIKDKLLTLDENISVYPGHNEETTIGDEKVVY